MDKISRRKLFEFTKGVIFPALLGAGPVVSTAFETKSLEVRVKEGNFHLRLFGHGAFGLFADLVEEKDFPPQVDAIFLEDFPSDEIFEEREGNKKSSSNEGKTSPDYTPSFDTQAWLHAFKRGVPLYFGDSRGTRDIRLSAFTTVLTEIALIAGAEKIAKKVFSRREALINAGAWSLAAVTLPGIYYSTFINSLLTQPWAETVRRMADEAEGLKLNSLVDYGIIFRNAQMGYKLLEIADRLRGEKGRKPEITIIAGNHRGLARWLEKGKASCLQIMTEYPKPLLEQIFGSGDYPERIASTLEVQLNRGGKFDPRVTLYQDPELYKAMGGEGEVTREREIKIAALGGPKKEAPLAFTRGKERLA